MIKIKIIIFNLAELKMMSHRVMKHSITNGIPTLATISSNSHSARRKVHKTRRPFFRQDLYNFSVSLSL